MQDFKNIQTVFKSFNFFWFFFLFFVYLNAKWASFISILMVDDGIFVSLIFLLFFFLLHFKIRNQNPETRWENHWDDKKKKKSIEKCALETWIIIIYWYNTTAFNSILFKMCGWLAGWLSITNSVTNDTKWFRMECFLSFSFIHLLSFLSRSHWIFYFVSHLLLS